MAYHTGLTNAHLVRILQGQYIFGSMIRIVHKAQKYTNIVEFI